MTDNNYDSSSPSSPSGINKPTGGYRKGHKKMGGRKKGTPNSATYIDNEGLRNVVDKLRKSGGVMKTPIEFFFDVFNDKKVTMTNRVAAARAAAAIIHPAAPKKVKISGSGKDGKVELTLLASDAHLQLERLINIDDFIEGEVTEVVEDKKGI
jgi:hypothetical protein